MTKARRDHWQDVYSTKPVDQVSWYQSDSTRSFDALRRLGATPDHSLIDIGAGASPLIAQCLEAGWHDLTALDISDEALNHARDALDEDAGHVEWIAADITRWSPSRTYDIWHDRAVFHFLTDHRDREKYKSALNAAVKPGGLLLFATFSPSGPSQCSGLPVQQYDAQSLARELGSAFALVEHWLEDHHTPWGAKQNFTWAAFRRETT